MAPHRGAGVQGVPEVMLDHTQGHTTVLGCSVRSPVLSHTDDSKTTELKLEGRRAAGSDRVLCSATQPQPCGVRGLAGHAGL